MKFLYFPDRSSVGHFHKEFDESKIMLEDYINTLRNNVQEKQKILPLLNSSEAFYALAQDEAKVIVNVILCSMLEVF